MAVSGLFWDYLVRGSRVNAMEGDLNMAQLTPFETVDIDGHPITHVTVKDHAPALIVMLRGLF